MTTPHVTDLSLAPPDSRHDLTCARPGDHLVAIWTDAFGPRLTATGTLLDLTRETLCLQVEDGVARVPLARADHVHLVDGPGH